MAMFIVLSGLGFALFALAIGAVIWAVRSGQYDDLDTPALRLLGEDVVEGAPRAGRAATPGPTRAP